MYFFVFFLFVICMVNMVYYPAFPKKNDIRRAHAFFILVFLDLIFGFLLIYCFVHKLFYLVIQQKESLSSLNNRDNNKNQNQNENKNELSQKELGYVRLATKYALLCSIAIIFT